MNLRLYVCVLVACGVVITGNASFAKDSDGKNTDIRPVPRFVSLQTDEANVRAGPGKRFPVKWVLVRQGLPLEVVQDMDVWRKVRDVDGETGWLHGQMLSNRRTAMVTPKDGAPVFSKPEDVETRRIGRADAGAIVELVSCGDDWCAVRQQGRIGYTQKKFLFGVYAHERFD